MISYSCLAALVFTLPALELKQETDPQRSRILANMQLVMGELPPAAGKVPLDVQVSQETRTAKYLRKKLTYVAESGDRVPAYLLIPLGRQPGQLLPAMLCLHQTTKIGKGEPAGLGGKVNLHYAHELAERGYVTLVPDYPSFGDYTYDFVKSAHASGSIKAIWNNIRAIDLLQALPEVDPDRIGCIGHSLGGHNSLFTAAFEPRLRAVVTSCGFTSFAKYFDGNLQGWTSPRYMPRIASSYELQPAKLPFDFSDVLTAIAPRALFVVAPLHDDNFNVDGVRDVATAIEPVFRQTKAKFMPTFQYPDCGHDFPPASREEVYAWLDKVLAPVDPASLSWRIEVKETAGIRRFSYPVRAQVPLPVSCPPSFGFRLLDGTKQVVAQFTRHKSTVAKQAFVDVDFTVQNAPAELHYFTLEAGEGIVGPPIKNGLRLEKLADRYVIRHSSGLRFGVPHDLKGFLSEVHTPRFEYVKPNSLGLWIETIDHKRRYFGSDEGPHFGEPTNHIGGMMTTLQFTAPLTDPNFTKGRCEVELRFPSAKSWVECTAECFNLPTIANIGLDLDLIQHKPPVLIDLGAGPSVYASLKPGQEIFYSAGRVRGGGLDSGWWNVDLKTGNDRTPYVGQDKNLDWRNAQGWVHVMDDMACTALAVAYLFEFSRTEFRIDSQAKIHLKRDVGGRRDKKLHFWLHFVDMPVQVGAVTSPQAMLTPPEVRVEQVKP